LTEKTKTTVEITISWDTNSLSVEIDDDGPGFPLTLLDRLGKPYLSTRSGEKERMGLGISIAKTLLSITNAELFLKTGQMVGRAFA
tara:strand:- start:372 stop:629 length:258 start_codon:yes stop_codon:yes gene_type:complete